MSDANPIPGVAPRRGLLRRGLSALADVVLPPACLACRAPLASHDALCTDCWRDIAFVRPPLCDRLGIPLPYDTGPPTLSAAALAAPPPYARARAVALYAGTMRTLVHDLKFRDRHDLRRLFARWLSEAGAELLTDAEVIVPVPLGRWRLLTRRFNQAALVAGELAAGHRLAFEPLALVRTRSTRPQVGLTRGQRRRNVAGAFAVPERAEAAIRGRKVVLVDDVITTGATVGACARSLRRAGAARVDVLALALVADATAVPE